MFQRWDLSDSARSGLARGNEQQLDHQRPPWCSLRADLSDRYAHAARAKGTRAMLIEYVNMHRISASKEVASFGDVSALRAAVKSYGLTQAALARAVGATQGQISRVLRGKSSKRSVVLVEICKYVHTIESGVSVERVRANDELIDAISKTWDGSEAHSRALASVIRSLGALGSGGRR